FGDTTYYLCVYGSNGCRSNYTRLNVVVNRRVPYDASVAEVLAPAYDKVYNECDTVVVRVCNYGTASLADFPVKYSFYLADDVVATPIQESVVEMFTDTLQPGQCGDLKFQTLMVIPDSLVNQLHRYQVRAWTDHPREMVRSNDTIYDAWQFATLPESAYCIPSVRNGNGPTMVSVSFNTMSNQVAALPYTYTNFGCYDSVSRITPVLHLSRGLFDSIVVHVVNVADLNDQTTPCTLVALIDYNRDGDFGGVGETVGTTVVCAGHRASLPVSIPAFACSGYMRMRLMLIKGTGMAVTPCAVVDNGHVQDYLLYVDGQVPAVDAALARIASPSGFEIVDSVVSPVLYLANKGSDVLHSATILYEYSQLGNAAVSSGSYQWSGDLQPGCFTRVQLPQYTFPLGTTDVVYRVETLGDAVTSNNTIVHQYHRFHTVRCLYQDDFDNATVADWWYAPQSGDAYDRNLWQLGTPSSAVVNHTYSGNAAWTTILDTLVVCGAEGNRSVLYSPYFDISIARPDTVEFYIHKDFLEGTRLQVEYLNASGNWVNLAPTSQRQAPQWYLSTAGFTGKSSDYVCVSVSMALPHIGMGNQYTQFRLIYTANIAATPTSRLDGCAIDNVRVTHQRGAVDVGIADVNLVPAAQVRRWVYPQVTIRNFGYDTVCDIPVQYFVYGATEPVSEVYDSCLPPDSSVVYTFKTPFLVDMSFPIIFDLQANTLLASDIFWENDSLSVQMTIDPTDDDLELRAFLSPRLNEAASDSVEVTIRMCNNGSYPIDTAVIQLDYNQQYSFEQSIHFDDLLGGEGLEGGACFNYTIPQRYHVSIGTTELVAVGWIAYDTQTSNDTLELNFDGLTNSIDLEADHVSFQTISQSYVAVKMAIRNAGARSVQAYVLSYWIDDDTTTKVVERVFNNPIASLTTSYYLFNSVLPLRDEPYSKITAVVYNIEDIDHSNDTTSVCLDPYVDLRVRKILILENADSLCLVRLVVENMGNSVLTDPFTIAAVINGHEISTIIHTYIHPEQVYELDFNITIPKDSLRHYIGSGWIVCDADTCEYNNQTSAIQVVNNFEFKESVPTVVTADSGVWVSDCFPNPSCTDAVFRLSLPTPQKVSVAVYGLDGRLHYAAVQSLAAGMHQQVVSARALPSGCYYYVVQTATTRKVRKMIVQH
ncbi:MAG: T9SS type A sorting domain-containing protein, partial [Bacteroidales bacterium]|nr:T9SS type A sorting domain-containing protein [Candidatus Colimorpha onthohippi]